MRCLGAVLIAFFSASCWQTESEDEGRFASTKQRQVAQLSLQMLVPDSPDASGALLVASEELYIAERVAIGQTGARQSLSSGGTLYIGDNSRADSLVARGTIQVRGGASASKAHSSTTVAVFPNASVPSIQQGMSILTKTLEFSYPPHSGTDGSVEVGVGQVATLEPGNYDVLSVKPNATLNLQAGTYSFSSIFLESASSLTVDADCGTQIYTHQGVFIRGQVSGTGPGLALTHVGTQDVHVEAPFHGRIVAPRSKVYLNSSAHRVQVLARAVRVQPDAVVLGQAGDAAQQGLSAFSPAPDACEGSVCCPSDEIQQEDGVSHDCRMGTIHTDLVQGDLGIDADVGVIFSGAGKDEFLSVPDNVMIAAGADDDRVCGIDTSPSLVDGGAGNDTIVIGNGNNTLIVPGAGRDTVRILGGTNRIVIMSACELEEGERYVLEGGSATVFAPVSREEMAALGVSIDPSIAVEEFAGNLCLSECSDRPTCGADEVCASDGVIAECVGRDDMLVSRTEVGPPSYPSLPDGLRQDVEEYVAKIERGEHFATAEMELRRAAPLIVPVLLDASATSHPSRRAAEVFALGSLFKRNALAALVDVTLQAGPPPPEGHYSVDTWVVANLHAVRWLAVAAKKEPHVPEHLEHLRQIMIQADRSTATAAVSAYLQVGDAATRRAELVAALPSTHQPLLAIEYR